MFLLENPISSVFLLFLLAWILAHQLLSSGSSRRIMAWVFSMYFWLLLGNLLILYKDSLGRCSQTHSSIGKHCYFHLIFSSMNRWRDTWSLYNEYLIASHNGKRHIMKHASHMILLTTKAKVVLVLSAWCDTRDITDRCVWPKFDHT